MVTPYLLPLCVDCATAPPHPQGLIWLPTVSALAHATDPGRTKSQVAVEGELIGVQNDGDDSKVPCVC